MNFIAQKIGATGLETAILLVNKELMIDFYLIKLRIKLNISPYS